MQIILRNVMEDYVILTLDRILDDLDCCKCEKCRLDIASYTLNRIPPKYVATTQGELMTKLFAMNTQFETNVVSEITKAAKIIGDNPRH